MGVVFQARHLELDMPVAIKVLTQEAGLEPDLRDRFLVEGRLAARVRHPNVVGVMEAGVTQDGVPYVVYEFLEGTDLSAVLAKRGRLLPSEAVDVVVAALAGLGAIHEAGIVHRDLKPANIILTATGSVKLLDFGLARNLLDARVRTLAGTVLGTPAYLSPEAITGGQIGPAMDIYSAGILLFELIAGRVPFDGATLPAVLEQQLHATPPWLGTLVQDVPPALALVVHRAIAKEPGSRYASAEAFRTALRSEVEAGAPQQLRRARLATVAIDTSNLPAERRSDGRTVARRLPRSRGRPEARKSSPRRRWYRRTGLLVFLFVGAAVGIAAFDALTRPQSSGHAYPTMDEAKREVLRTDTRKWLIDLATLVERERIDDEPSSVDRRLRCLKGALDGLERLGSCEPSAAEGTSSFASGSAAGIRMAAWVVAALLTDEARFAESVPGAAARTKVLSEQAARCHQRLADMAWPPDVSDDAGHGRGSVAAGLAVARAARDAASARALHSVAKLTLDSRTASRVRAQSMVEVLRRLRDASIVIESSRVEDEMAQAVGDHFRALSLSALTRAKPSGSVQSRSRPCAWCLDERERALLERVVVRLDAAVDPLAPLIGMCAADQARRWLRRESPATDSGRTWAAPSDGMGEGDPGGRRLGLSWIDLSWGVRPYLDENRWLRALRDSRALESPFHVILTDSGAIADYLSSRVDVLPRTQLLMDDRARLYRPIRDFEFLSVDP